MIANNLHIKEKVNLLLNQAYTTRTSNLPKSIDIAQEALKYSKSIDDAFLIAKSLNQLSLYYMIISDAKKSIEKAEEAISYFEILNDHRGIADAKYNIGSIHYKTNNYHLGLAYLIDALKIYRKYNDLYSQSKVEKAVGTIYEYIGDQQNAFRSYKSAIKAARAVENLNLESNVLNNFSGLMLKSGKRKIAMQMIKHSVALKKKTNDVRGYGFAVYGRGKVHLSNKDYKKAESDFLEAIEVHEKMQEYLGITMGLRKLGILFLELNELDKAEAFVEKSLKVSMDHNISMFKIKSFHVLYLILKKKNDSQKALLYLESYLKEKETLINAQTLKVVENYELINQMNKIEHDALIQKEKQKIISKKNKDEKEAVRLKQEFLSIMSHEIRTPLNAITTIVSLLSNDITLKNKELFGSLQFASKNLITIVNNILDFTKLDSNKAVIETHSTNLNVLCNNILNLHISLAHDKGLNLILENGVSHTNNYLIDQTKVTQILSNLIHNAVKFTKKGKIVFIINLVEENEGFDVIKFTVKDTGQGISKKDVNQIFESFSQVSPITTRTEGGTGLGLAIVKKLVELHDSTIHLNSSSKGSEFYFRLKLKKAKSLIVENEKSFNSLIGKTALIAEDTPINALLMKKVLSNWGMTSQHVVNGKEAFEMAKKKRFDFILMDIHMPEINGFEATRLIKNEENLNKYTPVFAVTADVLTNEDKENAALFDGILWKPLEIEKMFTILTKVIE